MVVDFKAWSLRYVTCRSLPEIGQICFLGELVPFAREDAFAACGLKSNSGATNTSEEVYECQLSVVGDKLVGPVGVAAD